MSRPSGRSVKPEPTIKQQHEQSSRTQQQPLTDRSDIVRRQQEYELPIQRQLQALPWTVMHQMSTSPFAPFSVRIIDPRFEPSSTDLQGWQSTIQQYVHQGNQESNEPHQDEWMMQTDEDINNSRYRVHHAQPNPTTAMPKRECLPLGQKGNISWTPSTNELYIVAIESQHQQIIGAFVLTMQEHKTNQNTNRYAYQTVLPAHNYQMSIPLPSYLERWLNAYPVSLTVKIACANGPNVFSNMIVDLIRYATSIRAINVVIPTVKTTSDLQLLMSFGFEYQPNGSLVYTVQQAQPEQQQQQMQEQSAESQPPPLERPTSTNYNNPNRSFMTNIINRSASNKINRSNNSNNTNNSNVNVNPLNNMNQVSNTISRSNSNLNLTNNMNPVSNTISRSNSNINQGNNAISRSNSNMNQGNNTINQSQMNQMNQLNNPSNNSNTNRPRIGRLSSFRIKREV